MNNAEEREIVETDALVVGAGPAGLACAIRLKQINPDIGVVVVEKGAEVGAHILSGAVIEPGPLDVLLPQWRQAPLPVFQPVMDESFFWLTPSGKIKSPLIPPPLKNHGNFIVSLGGLCSWMAKEAEALGVEIYAGFAGAKPIIEDNAVKGVSLGDMGIAKDGTRKPNYTAGVDLRAPVTFIAEGVRGSLAKQLISAFKLGQGKSPPTYGIGYKELWRLKNPVSPGLVIHTLGYPLPPSIWGGGFLYHANDNYLALGFVIGLDYQDPSLYLYGTFQKFKAHPMVQELIRDAELVSAGAKALVEGGWQSLPRMDAPGMALIGDAAGILNVPKLKGTHMAITSGMLAAEYFHARGTTQGFDAYFRKEPPGQELWRVRNIRAGFKWGFLPGMVNGGIEWALGGRTPWTIAHHGDPDSLKRLEKPVPAAEKLPVPLTPRDRLEMTSFAAVAHDEDQPVHLKVADTRICVDRCAQEFGNPCTRFCPASVYEMVETEEGKRLQINAANCVHCKTCDIKDPYQIIDWTPPEGGSGPFYRNL